MKLQIWKWFLPPKASRIHVEFLIEINYIPWLLDHRSLYMLRMMYCVEKVLSNHWRSNSSMDLKLHTSSYFFNLAKRQKQNSHLARNASSVSETKWSCIHSFGEIASPEKSCNPERTSYMLLSNCASLPWYPRWILCNKS